jgi:hypothetical protein
MAIDERCHASALPAFTRSDQYCLQSTPTGEETFKVLVLMISAALRSGPDRFFAAVFSMNATNVITTD